MKVILLFIVFFNVLLYISAAFIANSFDITQLDMVSKIIYSTVFVIFNLGFMAIGLGVYFAKHDKNISL